MPRTDDPSLDKPAHVFDRDREWLALSRFAQAPITPGGTGGRLGVVSGRRRQGKTFLLHALASAVNGFHFVAAEDTESEALRRFGEALGQRAGGGRYQFENWDEAIERLYAVNPDGLIVIDEFPYLSVQSPVLPSLLQRALDPGGVAHASKAKLLLCGSSLSVMGGLLAGHAPLRGRSSLELVVRPMDYRTAAEFWGCADQPRLAVLLHSVVGGTPAYRHDLVRSDIPESLDDFDDWVTRTVLDPSVPLFREARYLLTEEVPAREPANYHAVLAAIATGQNTRGQIATYLGKPSTHIGHPLSVLEDCGLIRREPDAFRSERVTFRIAEPLISFYEAVMRSSWTLLELGQGERAWQLSRERFHSQIVGPHFEQLCRDFVSQFGTALFGALPERVAAGTVNDPQNRKQIEIDVAVLTSGTPNSKERVLSLGECKWGTVMGIRHVERLRRARDLLAVKGFDTSATTLVCYSGAGFDAELRALADRDRHVLLIDLDRLYAVGE